VSSGAFVDSFYESNAGDIHPIRVQPESIIAGFNPAAIGPTTNSQRVYVTGSNRSRGAKARALLARWVGAPPAGYVNGGRIRLAVFTPNAYNALGAAGGDAFTYLGTSAVTTGKSPERGL
jgi:hypothetical protein